ncbi:MAG: DUF58 domain-containing protein [Sulfobacillus thermosulfidooxidans]|uniref:DUF58 domain-containing protein n=1 Tax=Sulfobacillus thermotolerans TaxID=338644 RepID=A0ABN5GWS5_9FIRM|nr:DUF58 domain-containing protein [Sulfobacillus sp. hq2]AUW92908.1 hypothetical protein BXT84_02220 [Sulfobacillus thermotolerans]MCY0907174.1 DUF58 domain-containing protein [Sulfobacillus thermotolerans]POB11231.1 hypothetical protein CO251_06755 [Sulfobacillus sp. hq2]PSR36501.1 MAG: DUF58 domain-containing protein [Sulfobacillus thermosulfidooxidans]
MKPLVWRSLVTIGIAVSTWSFAYFQGGYLAYHIWDTLRILAVLIVIQLLFPLRHLHVVRHLEPSEVMEGDTVSVSLVVSLDAWWPWGWVCVSDPLPLSLKANATPHFVLALWPHRRTTVMYQLANVRRGVYRLGQPVAVTGDIFGLWTKSRILDLPPATLVVWPKTIVLRSFGAILSQWEGTSEAPRRFAEESSLLFGIRDYVAGDRLAQIHWRTSARTGAFKVKQFEPMTHPRIRIILDTLSSFDNAEQWELAIQVAASLLHLSARYSQAAGLLWMGEGDQQFAVNTGQSHYLLMQNYLASLPAMDATVQETSMAYIPLDAIPLWITGSGTHPAMTPDAPVLFIGPNGVSRLEELPFYLERPLNDVQAIRSDPKPI